MFGLRTVRVWHTCFVSAPPERRSVLSCAVCSHVQGDLYKIGGSFGVCAGNVGVALLHLQQAGYALQCACGPCEAVQVTPSSTGSCGFCAEHDLWVFHLCGRLCGALCDAAAHTVGALWAGLGAAYST